MTVDRRDAARSVRPCRPSRARGRCRRPRPRPRPSGSGRRGAPAGAARLPSTLAWLRPEPEMAPTASWRRAREAARMTACHDALQGGAQVAEQVPAVGNVGRVRSPCSHPIGEGAGAVASDDLDAGMAAQPSAGRSPLIHPWKGRCQEASAGRRRCRRRGRAGGRRPCRARDRRSSCRSRDRAARPTRPGRSPAAQGEVAGVLRAPTGAGCRHSWAWRGVRPGARP